MAIRNFHFSPSPRPTRFWTGAEYALALITPRFFLTQLRALLRANAGIGNLHILFPMISRIHEISAALGLLDRAYSDLTAEGHAAAKPHIGAMIEVPSAAYIIAELAGGLIFSPLGPMISPNICWPWTEATRWCRATMTIYIPPSSMSWTTSSKEPTVKTSRSVYAVKWPGIRHPSFCSMHSFARIDHPKSENGYTRNRARDVQGLSCNTEPDREKIDMMRIF